MGMTLREIAVHTTNSEWKKEFFDRTRSENKEKPVFKILNIAKFGIYWITHCDVFFS
jgi:vacuolar protein sorting-associated protein 13A/C